MAKKRSKKPPCPICRTKSYKKDASGFYVCKFGHQLTGWHEEADDEEALLSMNSRTIKRRKGRKGKKKRKSTRIPFCHTAVLHLWLLYLESQKNLSFSDRHNTRSEADEDSDWAPSSQLSTDGESDSASSLSSGFSGTSGESAVSWRGDEVGQDARHPAGRRLSIVFCYMACVLLRLPVFIPDFRRWASTNQLPYFDEYSILPESLFRDYPQAELWCNKNRANALPSVPELREESVKLSNFFKKTYDVSFPSVNRPLFMLRVLEELMLPGRITRRAKMLCYDVFHQSITKYQPTIYPTTDENPTASLNEQHPAPPTDTLTLDDLPPPGSSYSSYSSKDHHGAFPNHLGYLIQKCADMVGEPTEYLIRQIHSIEKALRPDALWAAGLKKGSAGVEEDVEVDREVSEESRHSEVDE
ncbi:Pol I core factor CF [Rhizophlyctis rosea]|nr:Pol I core factor CF [Rhizophlyctis rosea]